MDYYELILTTSSLHFPAGLTERAKRESAWPPPHRVSPFSRGVIFKHARISLALLSLRKNGDYS